MLCFGAIATLATVSFANPRDPFAGSDDNVKKWNMHPLTSTGAARLGTSALTADTTWVGYNPAFATKTNNRGQVNYWSIGVGGNEPPAGSNNARRGYWDWDNPIHGDSLQGWWPVRFPYNSNTGLNANDRLRPWQVENIGNNVNYVINQGAGFKRTYGIVGVWHADKGNVIDSVQAGTNPSTPGWTPLGGSRSAWCGLRGHGDRSVKDPITGNPVTVEAMPMTFENGQGPNGLGTSRQFPGYAGLWDQMLYTDVPAPTGGNPLKLQFKLQTAMSTGKLTGSTQRGWFVNDTYSSSGANFISAAQNPAGAPIDSFQVYVGRPIEPVAGANNDYVGSDGSSHEIFDPLRRWLSETIAIQGGSAANTPHWEYGTSGNNAAGTVTLTIPNADVSSYGANVRIVFRVKTNWSFDDDFNGSTGTYSSNYAGAAQVDDVQIDNNGGGYVTIGTFEASDPARDNIDNTKAATAAWRSTGKPPGIFEHVADVNAIGYTDLCGPPGGPLSQCNMLGHVISVGDFDRSEAKVGVTGSSNQEIWSGITSPTINLVSAGPTTANEQGITGNMADATEDYYIYADLDAASVNLTSYGMAFSAYAQSYPASQEDGSVCWSDFNRLGFIFDVATQSCGSIFFGTRFYSLIQTTNAGEQPDSIKFGMRKQSYCYRFAPPDCGPGNLAYCWDNASLALVDAPATGPTTAPMQALVWEWIQDSFPANESPGLPGTAAFDTCAAWVKSGNQQLPIDDPACRRNTPGDTSAVASSGANIRMDVVFRINPGVGNYHTVGDKTSGLRFVPTNAAVITSTDGSFWSEYIKDNGAFGTGGNGTTGPGHNPALGTGPNFSKRWNPFVWNSARMDTVDFNVFQTAARSVGQTSVGVANFATMYHEDDPKFATLGKLKNHCFMWDTAGSTSDLSCGGVNELHAYPPAWITTVPASRTGWDGNLQTKECTKIFQDGIFTPGTHIEYFFRRQDLDDNQVDLMPDTNSVFPHNEEGTNTDGHRWREFNVLPDAWKFTLYGGLGQACMLYVDWDDANGDDRVWRSVADSIGATRAEKRGAGNGWSARGDMDVNDPSGFVYKNEQAGTTWDIYNVGAAESSDATSGTIGSRSASRTPCVAGNDLQAGKDARNAPTGTMLQAYYDLVFITTGNLVDNIFGPFINRSAQDRATLKSFMFSATSGHPRGVFVIGNSAIESIDPGAGTEPDLEANLGVNLVDPDWRTLSGDNAGCPDLIPSSAITTNGDLYGSNNTCFFTDDVLEPVSGESVALEYAGGLGAAILKTPSGSNHWVALTSGLKLGDLRSRFCESSFGRLAFFHNVFANVFGSLCVVNGDASITLDVPNNPNGKAFVDFMTLKNNPLVSGNAVISFGLSKSDRVTVKIYDVTGRLVRTLANGQLFAAGPHELQWDGVDNSGRQVARGVYFSSFETDGGKNYNRKMTVLK
jgi:hypothetical protein